MSLGSFSVSSFPTYVSGLSGSTLVFETVNFNPSGLAVDQLLENQEELSDVGVDKRRWRRINKQFRPFALTTTSTFTTYAGGIADYRKHTLAIGAIGTLAATLYSTNYVWNQVKVLDVVPRLLAGQMTGNGIGTSLAVLISEWSMVLSKNAGNT